MRVGMIETEHRKSALACLAPRGDMCGRLNEETVRIVRHIRRPHSLGNRGVGADQQTAAFRRQRLARVIDDGVERGAGDPNGYNASTAIAIPMPPPTQSAATP